MVIIMRRSISFFRTSFALTSSLVARSATVMPSASVIVRVTGGGARRRLLRHLRRAALRGAAPDARGPTGAAAADDSRATHPDAAAATGRTGCDGSGRGPPIGA